VTNRSLPQVRIRSLTHQALAVPLRTPFVIATARMDRTRARLVRATVVDDEGRTFEGLGEAATLPPVTHEDEDIVADAIDQARGALDGLTLQSLETLSAALDRAFVDAPVSRAGVESALLDAWARASGTSVASLLGDGDISALITDVTLPIAEPSVMAEDALAWRARGFQLFKVKVGKSLDHDKQALSAIASAVPDARLRIDANAGYSARDALALLAHVEKFDLALEHFEQPCARDDLAAMAEVSRHAHVPIIADESVRTLADLHAILDAKAAHGVNLKLVKSGGLIASYAIAQRARDAGLSLMCGAMVETRLGLSAMAQVVRALGGVEYVDLDTAFLLADDPFVGGYLSDGPRLTLLDGAGHGVTLR
jgi:L-Ala-D/L-Glu epimerase